MISDDLKVTAVGNPRDIVRAFNEWAPDQKDQEIMRLRTALKIIAGELPPTDNLLGHPDVARIALYGK